MKRNYVILCKMYRPTRSHSGVGVHNFPTHDKKLLSIHMASMRKDGWEVMSLTQRQAESMYENLGRKITFAKENL